MQMETVRLHGVTAGRHMYLYLTITIGYRHKTGEKTDIQRVLVEKPEGKRSLPKSRRRWKNSKCIFRKQEMKAWKGLIWLRTGTSMGLL